MLIINESSTFESSVRTLLYGQLQAQVPNELKVFIKFDSSSNSYKVENDKHHYYETTSNYSPLAYFKFLKNDVIFQNMVDEPCFILQDYSLLTPSFSSNYFESKSNVQQNPFNIIVPSKDEHFDENAVIHSSIIKTVGLRTYPSSNELVQMQNNNIIDANAIIIDKLQNHPMLYIDKVPFVYEYDRAPSYFDLKDKCTLITNDYIANNNKLYKVVLDGKPLFITGAFYPHFSILNATKVIQYTGKYSIQKELEINSVSQDFSAMYV